MRVTKRIFWVVTCSVGAGGSAGMLLDAVGRGSVSVAAGFFVVMALNLIGAYAWVVHPPCE